MANTKNDQNEKFLQNEYDDQQSEVINLFDFNKDKNVCKEEIIEKRIDKFEEEEELNDYIFDKNVDYDRINAHLKHYDQITLLYIDNTQKRLKSNYNLKIAFFILVMSFLLSVIVMCGVAIFLLIRETSWETITGAIVSILGIISSIIILPKIICDYLFPKNEDEFVLKLMEQLDKIDSNWVSKKEK